MGKSNQGNTLVVMTNGDVYYITPKVAQHLLSIIQTGDLTTFFRFVDAKSLAYITVATANISSIVEENRDGNR